MLWRGAVVRYPGWRCAAPWADLGPSRSGLICNYALTPALYPLLSTSYALPPTLYPLPSTSYPPTNSRMGECSTRYCGRPVGSRMVVLAVLIPRL